MKLLRACLTALSLLVLVPSTHAGVTLVLKLKNMDGTFIQGESEVSGHPNEITLSSVSFSTEQANALKDASKVSGLGAGKAIFTPITITKGADKASAQLFLNNVLGKPIKYAKITFITQDDGASSTPVEFFTITLGTVYISKYSVNASIGDNNSVEEITLNYGQALVTYKPIAGGDAQKKGFDLLKNKEVSDINE